MPEVSIITPSYNASEFLEETIQAVFNQTFEDWEWLITDDQSQDDSVKIIQKYQDPRVKLTIAEKNGGAGQARNLSLEKATGRFITFLDSDDYWEPEFLEKMIGFMKENKAELAYSNYARCNEKLEPVLQDFQADTEVTFNNY